MPAHALQHVDRAGDHIDADTSVADLGPAAQPVPARMRTFVSTGSGHATRADGISGAGGVAPRFQGQACRASVQSARPHCAARDALP
jgi:hypothetical protein